MGKLTSLFKLDGRPKCSRRCPKCSRRCIYDQSHSYRHYCSKHGSY